MNTSPILAEYAPPSAAAWAGPATGAAVVVTLALLPLTGWLANRLHDQALWRLLVLLLPLHLGGSVAALAVLRLPTAPQPWTTTFGLTWPLVNGDSGWCLTWRTARRLAWVYPLCLLLTGATALLCQTLGQPVAANPMLLLVREMPGVGFWLVAPLLLGLLTPLTEELLFRVMLHDALAAVTPAFATTLTALGFAALHGNLAQAPALFLLGLILQQLRTRSGSLWPALTLHMGFNLLALAILPWLPAPASV
ncbi:MAG: CPBP family intramembrane glutamic endopeptidase [bacterium]